MWLHLSLRYFHIYFCQKWKCAFQTGCNDLPLPHSASFLFWQTRGFVNYYGPQRFGSGQSVQSDRVGLALIKEDMVSVSVDYHAHNAGRLPAEDVTRG